jgi:NTE family protein
LVTVAGASGPRIALVLPGGGARSAWQVGVLRAIAGWFPRGAVLPFRILSGTSAGAINATVLAAHGDDFRRGAAELARVWADFRVGQVFHAGPVDMLRSGLHLALALATGGWLLPVPRALLDNAPLRALLARNVDFDRLRRTIAAGHPEALAISATSLSRGESVTFVEAARGFEPWERAGRRGTAASLRIDHLMASAAVPFLFPPVGLNLFLSSQRFGQPLPKLYRHVVPFLLILGLGVLLITYMPSMSLGMLRLLGGTP